MSQMADSTPMLLTQRSSQLLEYLPGIYRDPTVYDDARGEQERTGSSRFLESFLLPFERILLDDLEQRIADLHKLLEPENTPAEFLSWLASWVALSFDVGLDEPRRRQLLSRIVPLYRLRGTKRYLLELIDLLVGLTASIEEMDLPPLEVGRHSTVGVDTCLGGGPPFFFRVELDVPQGDAELGRVHSEIARRVIDLGKPAHTCFELAIAGFPRRGEGEG